MKGYRKIERARATKGATSWSRRDSGQITILVALAMGTFLLGFVGFGADMTNLWFHRQAAQNAADSACLAGAMDMLYAANAGTPNAPTGGLVAGLWPDVSLHARGRARPRESLLFFHARRKRRPGRSGHRQVRVARRPVLGPAPRAQPHRVS